MAEARRLDDEASIVVVDQPDALHRERDTLNDDLGIRQPEQPPSASGMLKAKIG
jgi:hypothetical protein